MFGYPYMTSQIAAKSAFTAIWLSFIHMIVI